VTTTTSIHATTQHLGSSAGNLAPAPGDGRCVVARVCRRLLMDLLRACCGTEVLSGLPPDASLSRTSRAGPRRLARIRIVRDDVSIDFSIHSHAGRCAMPTRSHNPRTDLCREGYRSSARLPPPADRSAAEADYGCQQVRSNPEMSSLLHDGSVKPPARAERFDEDAADPKCLQSASRFRSACPGQSWIAPVRPPGFASSAAGPPNSMTMPRWWCEVRDEVKAFLTPLPG